MLLGQLFGRQKSTTRGTIATAARHHAVALLAICLPFAALANEDRVQPITVFAAASLTDTLQQIGDNYTESSGVPVKISFAASSALARQIEVGAQVDVFFSADQQWMDYLQQRKLIEPASRSDLLGNRLALVAPSNSNISIDLASPSTLTAALGRSGRMAIGEPDSVPAGRYARDALVKLGAWNALAPRLARAENVRVALMYVARGETPLGIVYATDAAVEPRVRIVELFPADSHARITYPVALTRTASAAARQFVAHLGSTEAKRIFEAAGFEVLPNGAPASPTLP